MYPRAAFAIAAAEAQRNAERGLGYAIRDEEGRFFCGFEQANGALAHGNFIQNGNYWRDIKDNHFKQDTPVFLSLDDMRQKNIGAAVFGMAYEVNAQNGLPSALAERCKRHVVRKDLTHKPDPNVKPTGGPLYAPVSKAGLASADACEKGYDDGYIGLFYGLKQGWKRLWEPKSP
ncbi:MAG: hypothetical protein NDJ24_07325 [Alphaproteobacteria bacterium]|nr:hypothetical protein [Alphaproteobacteria bacterium]